MYIRCVAFIIGCCDTSTDCPMASSALLSRIGRPSLLSKIMPPESTIQFFKNGKYQTVY